MLVGRQTEDVGNYKNYTAFKISKRPDTTRSCYSKIHRTMKRTGLQWQRCPAIVRRKHGVRRMQAPRRASASAPNHTHRTTLAQTYSTYLRMACHSLSASVMLWPRAAARIRALTETLHRAHGATPSADCKELHRLSLGRIPLQSRSQKI
jgi:hypothetical protein